MGVETYNRLIELGFSAQEINGMTRKFPNTLNLSPEKVKSVFEELIAQGISRQDVHYFIVHTPSILGKAIQTIRKQFDLYREIFEGEYIDVLRVNPRRIVQGYDTSVKKYTYLKNRGVPLEQIKRDFFIGRKQFLRKYNYEI